MDITHLTHFIIEFRYLLLFPLMLVEGPAVTLFAAVLAAGGTFSVQGIFIVSVVANICSDVLHYAVGRWGGPSFIKRWGRYIRVDVGHVSAVERHFVKHAGKTLVLGKLAFGLGSLILIAAGLAKYSVRRFLLYCLLIELPKTVFIMALGYYGAKSYASLSHYFTLSGFALFAVGLLIVAGYLYVSRRAKRALESNIV